MSALSRTEEAAARAEVAREEAKEAHTAIDMAMQALGIDANDERAYGILDTLYDSGYYAGQAHEYSYPS